jgi:3-hydroxyacyl-CoA dehydrogenase
MLPARNKIAAAGLDAAKKSKPAAFMEPSLARFVTVGNFDDDLKKLAEVDWIIEAVVENLEIKRALLRKVEAIRKPGTIITTNTSGLPVGKIAEGFSDDFRGPGLGRTSLIRRATCACWNYSDAGRRSGCHRCRGAFLRRAAGQGRGHRQRHAQLHRQPHRDVFGVECDAPDAGDGPHIEEVDALTGQAVGWPKSATFRTIDLVGLDILGHVVGNMTSNVHDERSDLRLPDFFTQMLQRKWLGDKTKGGFYKKAKGGEARKTSAWRSTGRRWNTIRGRNRSSPRSTWRRTSKTRRALANAARP